MLPDRFVIRGTGLAAWLCADVLTRAFARSNTQVVLVLDGAAATGIEALPPRGIELAGQLGYSERFLAEAGQAAPLLGHVVDPGDRRPQFFGFGPVGVPLGPVAFHHVFARLRAEGEEAQFANYDFNALAAQSGRYSDAAQPSSSVASALEPGLAIDTDALAAALATRARACGLGVAADVSMAPGDLLIDCQPHGEGPIPLPLPPGPPPLYAVLTRNQAGWNYQICTLRRQSTVPATPKTGADHLEPWRGRTIDLGLTLRAVPDWSGLRLQLVLAQLNRLLALLPSGSSVTEEREYNRLTLAEVAAARDWADAMIGQVGSEQLQYKRAVFGDCGRVPMFDEEPIDECAWANLFLAWGEVPQSWDAQLNGVPAAALREHSARIRAVMIEGLRNLPVFDGASR